MNTMSYQGYTARVEYDDRDHVFVGRLLGLRTIISFEGESVTQLRAAFKQAVEDSLADCQQAGISPEKPVSGHMLLRVGPDVHGQAMVAAYAEGKSLNQWATEALQQALKKRGQSAMSARS